MFSDRRPETRSIGAVIPIDKDVGLVSVIDRFSRVQLPGFFVCVQILSREQMGNGVREITVSTTNSVPIYKLTKAFWGTGTGKGSP